MKTDNLRVAYHEAAHAVASFRAGALPRVTMIPTEETLGAVDPDGLDGVDDRTYVRVCLAGPAMDIERGREISQVRAEMWMDFEMAAKFIRRNGWDEATLLSETRAWVQSELVAITAVAERLFVDHELKDHEVALIVGDADGELEAPLDLLLRVFREGK
jgi:hypothetical protein